MTAVKRKFNFRQGQSEGADFDDQGQIVLLQSFDGLDVQSGLLTMNGNIRGYFNLLGQFVNNHGSDASALEALLKEGDLDALSKKAHSLKGVSATLGAFEIQKLAKKLEIGSKGRIEREELETDIKALAKSIDSFLKEYERVSQVLQPDQYQMKLGAINISQMNELLSKLEGLLNEFDASVNDLIEDSGGYLIEMFGDEARLLCNQISEFEYANAKNTLHLLMNLKNV